VRRYWKKLKRIFSSKLNDDQSYHSWKTPRSYLSNASRFATPIQLPMQFAMARLGCIIQLLIAMKIMFVLTKKSTIKYFPNITSMIIYLRKLRFFPVHDVIIIHFIDWMFSAEYKFFFFLWKILCIYLFINHKIVFRLDLKYKQYPWTNNVLRIPPVSFHYWMKINLHFHHFPFNNPLYLLYLLYWLLGTGYFSM